MKCLFWAIVAFCIHHRECYKAAVVEYNPTLRYTPKETIKENLKNYKYYIQTLKNQSVDIIVFPEYGLTTAFVDPKDFAVELTNDAYIIKELRYLSIENQMYVVINLFEKSTDVDNRTKYYNTNLVFDRKGNTIAKYHKMHLFQEPTLTPGNRTVVFETDFGVRFGLFTCFDMLFYTPSRSILEDGTVTDIVFPTAWTFLMPFFTSLSIQHGYAIVNRVNLLAASYNEPSQGLGGSGIHLASGKSLMYISSLPFSTVLVQDVPKIGSRLKPHLCSSSAAHGHEIFYNGPSNILFWFKKRRMFDTVNYKFQDLDLSKQITSTTLCYNSFCCNFNITIAQPANFSEHYKLVVYDGEIRKFLPSVSICSLVACTSASKDSCGVYVDGTTNFTNVTVETQLDNANTTFYTPITLNFDLGPMGNTIYCKFSRANQSYVRLSTTKAQKGVLAFGILGRTNAANSFTFSGLSFVLVLAAHNLIV